MVFGSWGGFREEQDWIKRSIRGERVGRDVNRDAGRFGVSLYGRDCSCLEEATCELSDCRDGTFCYWFLEWFMDVMHRGRNH